MSDQAKTVRAAEVLNSVWASMGRQGDALPLRVSVAQYGRLVSQGCPPGLLRVVEAMPVGERV